MPNPIAPELKVSKWLNTDKDITLADLRGKVVVIEAFQMLCPGCVSHGLPMAQKIHQTFGQDQVAVIGLHTVFEHHAAMTPVSLEAFLYEYRLSFPVGVDQAGEGNMPMTMQAYRMQGTPSLILIDKQGHLRANHFGQVSELLIGAEIATLTGEKPVDEKTEDGKSIVDSCDENGCPIT